MHQQQHNIYYNPRSNSTTTTNNMSSTSGNLNDPRFLVMSSLFTLYGLFILGVCLFSAASFWKWVWNIVKKIGLKIGLMSNNGSDETEEEVIIMGQQQATANRSDEGTLYQLLSERSKRRIDTLRQLAIEKLLLNYSLTLEEENVVGQREKITLEMDTKTTIDNSTAVVETTMISNENDSASNTIPSTSSDIEEGFYSCSENLSENDLSDIEQDGDAKEVIVERCEDDDDEDHGVKYDYVKDHSDNYEPSYTYTHVLIPFPGVGLDGLCIETSLTSDDNSGNKSSSNGEVKRKWPFIMGKHISKRKEDEVDNNNNTDICTTIPPPENEAAAAAALDKNNKLCRRQVPIFCSICLSEFDLSQQICWSSNTACTHVFHSECMIQWLVALGRKHSSMKRFPWNPSERQLVGHYELQCPCCRQEFIKSAFVETKFCDAGSRSSSSSIAV